MKNGRYVDGAEVCWYLEGILHREDGPAIEWTDGTQHWYQHGVIHREDGPAIIVFANGKQCITQWFISGVMLKEEEFNQWLMKKNLNAKLQELPHKPVAKKGKI